MKEQVKELFSEVTMPEKTEQAILRSLRDKKTRPSRSKSIVPRAAAFAAMLALLLSLSPQIQAAVKELVLQFEDGITLYETKDENGRTSSVVVYATESPAWAELREDQLYFLGHGQEIDITSQITEESPYFYTYTDENGYVHHMAVGYSGELSNFGIYEFIKNPDGSWLTGAGRNFLNPETEARYPWVDIIWEKWNIPWSKPGSEAQIDIAHTEP